MGEEVRYLGGDDLLCIAGPKTRLHHRSRIDVDLERGLASTQNISLEVWRDVDYEGVSSAVHQGNDVPLGDQLRRLEIRWQECMCDSVRELGMVLVDDSDRSVIDRKSTRLNSSHLGISY